MAHDTVPMKSSIYSIAYIEGSDPVAYDPSYGLGPYRTIHDWETNSITGYALGDNSGIKEFQSVVE